METSDSQARALFRNSSCMRLMLARHRSSDCAFCAFSQLGKEGIRRGWRPWKGLAAGFVERRDELLDAEPAELPGAGIIPKAFPSKWAAEKDYVPDSVKPACGSDARQQLAAAKLSGVGQFPGTALIGQVNCFRVRRHSGTIAKVSGLATSPVCRLTRL